MPTPHTAYPTKAEVDTFLAALPNITVPAELDTDPNIRAAIGEWERLTEYAPFLSTGATATVLFDPPGPRTGRPMKGGSHTLILGAGLLSLASLCVGVTNDDAGTELEEGSDFWLRPSDAPRRGRPYTSIEFASVQRGYPDSISVRGVWGFGATITDEAWKAVLDLAAASALQDLREGLALGYVETKDDEVSLRQSIERLGQAGDALTARGASKAIAYRLIS